MPTIAELFAYGRGCTWVMDPDTLEEKRACTMQATRPYLKCRCQEETMETTTTTIGQRLDRYTLTKPAGVHRPHGVSFATVRRLALGGWLHHDEPQPEQQQRTSRLDPRFWKLG